MIGAFRNFAKTKFAGLLVIIMIIPFVFWGMGSMFSSGNTNNIAKINKRNITTQEFIDHINKSNIPQQTIKENIDKNIIEELLSTLISTTLLELEVDNFNIIVSEKSLSEKIRLNKNFLDENGNFQRMKYEKFLLENNQSATGFELRLKGRELQKNLFDYIGAGTRSPSFLTKKLFEEENTKLELQFFELKDFYKKRENFTTNDIEKFIGDNNERLKVEYIDFDYAIINPMNLIGVNEFNQAFFDKIDQIEIDISNNLDLKSILKEFDIKPISVKNFTNSSDKSQVEKKIFQVKQIEFDIIEDKDNYIIYKIINSEEKIPDINDPALKGEMVELMYQQNKYDYNSKLLRKISDKNFNDDDFTKMSKNNIQKIIINSIKDNKKFDINAIELIYSMPENSFSLINDEKNNIYLAKIKKRLKNNSKIPDKDYKEYINKQNTNNKNSILKSYDLLLNDKYSVVLNEKTIERVKNFFQ